MSPPPVGDKKAARAGGRQQDKSNRPQSTTCGQQMQVNDAVREFVLEAFSSGYRMGLRRRTALEDVPGFIFTALVGAA